MITSSVDALTPLWLMGDPTTHGLDGRLLLQFSLNATRTSKKTNNMSTLPTSKFNPGKVITSMPPSRRAMIKAHRNAMKLSGKLSKSQIAHIRYKRTKAAQEAQE